MKSKEQILMQQFITPQDLYILSGFGINKCQKILREIREEMKAKNMYIPYERKLMIPTHIVRKKLHI